MNNRNQPWTRQDRLMMFRMLAAKLEVAFVAEQLGRSEFAIQCQIDDVTHKGLKTRTSMTTFKNEREQIICAVLAGFITE